MRFEDFFADSSTQLPAQRHSEDFLLFLRESFDAYLRAIASLDRSDDRCKVLLDSSDSLAKECDFLFKTVKSYFNGHPSEAQELINGAINSVPEYFNSLCHEEFLADRNLSNLYRLRVKEGNRLSRGELFHIPFELRGNVRDQRYSIAGLPCLYLGSSLYVCWEELSRPELTNLQASRFKVVDKETASILDLGIRPYATFQALTNTKRIFQQGKEFQEYVNTLFISRAACWPIQFSCSIIAKHPNDAFKPEYVIPQLLLEWITLNRGYDGIRYFSMAVPDYETHTGLILNFVFPTRTISSTGYCSELSKKFVMSRPISCGLAQYLESESIHLDSIRNEPFGFGEGQPVSYFGTVFSRIQRRLDSLDLAYVNA